jgi:hypothetical protein
MESQGNFETSQQTSPLMRLPREIIHEIVKYDPGCTINLAFTCKEMYKILQKEVNIMKERELERRQKYRIEVNKVLLRFFFKHTSYDDIKYNYIGEFKNIILKNLGYFFCVKRKSKVRIYKFVLKHGRDFAEEFTEHGNICCDSCGRYFF